MFVFLRSIVYFYFWSYREQFWDDVQNHKIDNRSILVLLVHAGAHTWFLCQPFVVGSQNEHGTIFKCPLCTRSTTKTCWWAISVSLGRLASWELPTQTVSRQELVCHHRQRSTQAREPEHRPTLHPPPLGQRPIRWRPGATKPRSSSLLTSMSNLPFLRR